MDLVDLQDKLKKALPILGLCALSASVGFVGTQTLYSSAIIKEQRGKISELRKDRDSQEKLKDFAQDEAAFYKAMSIEGIVKILEGKGYSRAMIVEALEKSISQEVAKEFSGDAVRNSDVLYIESVFNHVIKSVPDVANNIAHDREL